MLRTALLGSALILPVTALACGDKAKKTATADTEQVDKAHADMDPTECAKKAELVGSNCSYSTGMMAQRVIAEGSPWSFDGTLAATDAKLKSHVAAPYTVGPDGVHVVANEVLEAITEAGLHSSRVNLEGKTLEVDGVTYFVLTGYSAKNA